MPMPSYEYLHVMQTALQYVHFNAKCSKKRTRCVVQNCSKIWIQKLSCLSRKMYSILQTMYPESSENSLCKGSPYRKHKTAR
jgi:hypothetical protein